MARKLNSSKVDLIIIVIILIAGLKFTFGLENTLDITLQDESEYLYRGVTLWNTGLPHPSWSPLYVIWYFLISFLEPNKIGLYYLNYKLTVILLPILTYSVLRRSTVSIPVSLIISWLLLVSHANALTWPRVSHFALLLILATFLFIGHKRSLLWSSLFASMGALLVSYARPEYFLTYALSTLLFVFLFIRDCKKLEKRYLLGVMAYGLFSALVLAALGLPVTGNRSMFAFGQHFSLNWVHWNASDLDPWVDWREIISRNFGSPHSILEAFVNNPSAFLIHITHNLLEFARFIPKLFFPANANEISGKVIALLGIGLLVGLLVACLSNTRYKRLLLMLIYLVRKNLQEYKRVLIFVAFFLLPTFVSILIIYPRDHYLLVFSVLIVMIPAILLTNHDSKQGQINLKKLLLLCVLLVFITPQFSQSQMLVQKHLHAIQYIQSLQTDEPINLLDSYGGYYIYLDGNFRRLGPSDKNTNFDQFRVDQNINLIVVSNELRHSGLKNDPEWQGFLVNYRQFGFVQVEIPYSHRKILVQANLLHK